MPAIVTLPKRLLVGRPMRGERLQDTLLPKKLALRCSAATRSRRTPWQRASTSSTTRKGSSGLERDATHPRHLVTEPGVGYRFEP